MRRRERPERLAVAPWGSWPYALPFGRVQCRAWRRAIARRLGLRFSQVRVSARLHDASRLCVVVRAARRPTGKGWFKATDRGRSELLGWFRAPYSRNLRGFPSRVP